MYQEKMYADLKGQLAIDSMRLDEGLQRQPMLFQSVAEIAADALQIRDAAKNDLDIAKADAARRLRKDPDENGKPLAETRIASMLPLDKKVQEAQDLLSEAEHDLDYWQALVDAYNQRGSSLRRIAELTTAGYLTPNAAYKQRQEDMTGQRRTRFKFPPE